MFIRITNNSCRYLPSASMGCFSQRLGYRKGEGKRVTSQWRKLQNTLSARLSNSTQQ
jgi:hypothetical protein